MWWAEIAAQGAFDHSGEAAGIHVDPTAEVSGEALINAEFGPVVIGPRTKVCRGAHIVGPVRIGSDCLIGDGTMVRAVTTIGDGTRIGFATEIKNAIIGCGVTIGPQCFVADSKIEQGAYLGAQVRTSNHRLDGRTIEVMVDGCRLDTGLEKLGCWIGARASLGIQVIVLPGREIAADSLFAPRVTVERNLPTGRYRAAQQIESF